MKGRQLFEISAQSGNFLNEPRSCAFFIAELLQIFRQNFYSNASCFSLLWLYLGNSQVSVYRTIGPTLVFRFEGMFTANVKM